MLETRASVAGDEDFLPLGRGEEEEDCDEVGASVAGDEVVLLQLGGPRLTEFGACPLLMGFLERAAGRAALLSQRAHVAHAPLQAS